MLFRLLLYLAFVLIAAPFEILLDLWAGVIRPDPKLMWKPIATGALYLYSFTLVVETWFRLQEPEVLQSKPWLKWLQVVCLLLVLFFMIDYMGELRPKLNQGMLVVDSGFRQFSVFLLALVGSLVAHFALERDPSAKASP